MSYFELMLKMLMLGELTLLDLGGKKKKNTKQAAQNKHEYDSER